MTEKEKLLVKRYIDGEKNLLKKLYNVYEKYDCINTSDPFERYVYFLNNDGDIQEFLKIKKEIRKYKFQ